eukprot:TRINITY_DN1838_c0_g1_i3.p2 TRINITY_DN1838_c0_g1~~TRINITY_DN1838_c0_g1_i3.p2  ORF type:complete len:211 (-),score=49.57 TRINITY_DN1838_c0_g1_i3:98-730(-)
MMAASNIESGEGQLSVRFGSCCLLATSPGGHSPLTANLIRFIMSINAVKTSRNKIVVKSVFDQYDADKSGKIDSLEMHELLYDIGFFLEVTEMDKVMASIDHNSENPTPGYLDFETFYRWWIKTEHYRELSSTKDMHNVVEASKMFRQYDIKNHGYIDIKDYKTMCEKSGWNLTPQQIEDAMKTLDKDGDGKVTLDEFVKWLKWIPSIQE